MAAPANQHRGGSGLRSSLVVLGALLGIAAVCLIVFGTTDPRRLLIGIIVGLWAALLAAFGLPGLKRAAPDSSADLQSVQSRLDEVELAQLRATQDGLAATQESIAAQGVEIRRLSELQLARETAARRESDLALQLAIRKEVEQTVAAQFTGLREEVTALRAEVLENLGGQIKLERIETTRVIGSDLEALQDEIRRLATQREPVVSTVPTADVQQPQMPARAAFSESAAANSVFSESAVYTGKPVDDIIDAEIVEPPSAGTAVSALGAEQPAPEHRDVTADIAIPTATEEAASGFGSGWGPVRSVHTKAAQFTVPEPPPIPAPPLPEPIPAPAPAPAPLPPLEPPPLPADRPVNVVGLSAGGRDPFADLPRLTPVPPDLLGLSGKRRAPEDEPDPGGVDAGGSGRRRAPGHASSEQRR